MGSWGFSRVETGESGFLLSCEGEVGGLLKTLQGNGTSTRVAMGNLVFLSNAAENSRLLAGFDGKLRVPLEL